MEVLGCVCFVCRLDSDVWPDGVERLNNTLLFLRPLQRNDSGVYRCEVANSIDLRSRDLRILIQGESPPRRPRPLPGTPRPSDHAPSRAHPVHQTTPPPGHTPSIRPSPLSRTLIRPRPLLCTYVTPRPLLRMSVRPHQPPCTSHQTTPTLSARPSGCAHSCARMPGHAHSHARHRA